MKLYVLVNYALLYYDTSQFNYQTFDGERSLICFYGTGYLSQY